MAIQINYNSYTGIFAIPTEVVDKHLRLCAPGALKILLFTLRHPTQTATNAMLCRELGLGPADVADGLHYWVEAGLLREVTEDEQAEQLAFAAEAPISAPQFAKPPQMQTSTPQMQTPPRQTAVPPVQVVEHSRPGQEQKIQTLTSRPKLSSAEIARLAAENSGVAFLLHEAQQKMGKTLSPMEIEALASLYTYAGVAVDYILLVIVYCVSQEKNNMRYIEKTIYSWLDKNIDSYEKAEEYIKEQTEQKTNISLIKSAFGIYDRSLTPKEKQFVKQWFDELHFDMAMVKLAYEKTIDSIGKLSFPYISTILNNWHAKGLQTPRQVQDEEAGGNNKKQQQELHSSLDAKDMSELDYFITFGKRMEK